MSRLDQFRQIIVDHCPKIAARANFDGLLGQVSEGVAGQVIELISSEGFQDPNERSKQIHRFIWFEGENYDGRAKPAPFIIGDVLRSINDVVDDVLLTLRRVDPFAYELNDGDFDELRYSRYRCLLSGDLVESVGAEPTSVEEVLSVLVNALDSDKRNELDLLMKDEEFVKALVDAALASGDEENWKMLKTLAIDLNSRVVARFELLFNCLTDQILLYGNADDWLEFCSANINRDSFGTEVKTEVLNIKLFDRIFTAAIKAARYDFVNLMVVAPFDLFGESTPRSKDEIEMLGAEILSKPAKSGKPKVALNQSQAEAHIIANSADLIASAGNFADQLAAFVKSVRELAAHGLPLNYFHDLIDKFQLNHVETQFLDWDDFKERLKGFLNNPGDEEIVDLASGLKFVNADLSELVFTRVFAGDEVHREPVFEGMPAITGATEVLVRLFNNMRGYSLSSEYQSHYADLVDSLADGETGEAETVAA